MIDGIERYGDLIFYKINKFLVENYQKNYIIDFDVVENSLFLFTEAENGTIKEKNLINIDLEDTSLLYEKLYQLFLNNYLESNTIKISIIKEINLVNPNNPYLKLKIRDKIYNTEVDFYLKNFGKEREVLTSIEEDWIRLIEEKKSSRK